MTRSWPPRCGSWPCWCDELTPLRRRVVTFAVLDLPASAIRRYLLAGRPPPGSLDPPVLAAARAAA